MVEKRKIQQQKRST